MGRVTIYDIAEKLDLNYSTVSRVLNGHTHLYNEKTVERILNTADQLGYRPNLIARSVKSGKTRIIGVIFNTGSGTFTSDLHMGIYEYLCAKDYLPISIRPTPTINVLEQVHKLLDFQFDGFIIWPAKTFPIDQFYEEVKKKRIPVVGVNNVISEEHFDFVGTDNEFGSRKLAEYLLDLGHRNFGILDYEETKQSERIKTFCRIIDNTPGTYRQEVLINRRVESAEYNGALKLLQSKPRPTATFSHSYIPACWIYRAASKLGLRIPEDISVTCFSGINFPELITPSLTTVLLDPYGIGKEAARMVLERIEKKVTDKELRKILLKPELIIRESTGPVNSK